MNPSAIVQKQLDTVKANPGVWIAHDCRAPQYEVIIISNKQKLHPIIPDAALSDEGWAPTVTFRKLNTRFQGLRPSAQTLAHVAITNAQYPEHMQQVPPSALPDGTPTSMISVWRSRYFVAQVHREPNAIRISVNRTEYDTEKQSWKESISWDELMAIKQQIGYGNQWAYECFPAEVDTVNVSNMRHLFIPDERPAFGWTAASEAHTV